MKDFAEGDRPVEANDVVGVLIGEPATERKAPALREHVA